MDRLLGCLPDWVPPWAKAWLKEQLNHLKSYEKRIGELEGGIQKLKEARDKVQHKVDEEVNRYGRQIEHEVDVWIEGLDKIISEYEDFRQDIRYACAMFDLLSSGYLPKPGIRYRLSRKADVITKKVNGLLQKANHETISYWHGPPSMAAFLSNIGYESFESRQETMQKINAGLKDPGIRMIGVHGWSGVGKTTLVRQVVKEALEAKMFDVVVVANVTGNPNIRKIQGEIADWLGMKLDEESITARAARIRQRLKNEKENTLIVLDDLWANLDLNMLGIPFANDDDGQKNLKEGKISEAGNVMEIAGLSIAFNIMKTEKETSSSSNKIELKETVSRYKGCKLLMISESKKLLSSQMDGKGTIFSVDVLKEKEAQDLFKIKAGISGSNSEFQRLAAQIANKCEGLPMSIVTTAKALKNQSLYAWENVVVQLERQTSTRSPDDSTKLSFKLLETEDLKNTFLLCARMDHDALIMDLVRYCIGLGFLEGIYTVWEARLRVLSLLAKLKESGLLSDSYSSDRFTMQNIVRRAALSIASEEKHVFTMTRGKLLEWPDRDKLKSLRVFHVDNNDPHMKIPKDFFNGMKELGVLVLTGIDMSSLLSSITCLMELKMLCLERCKLGEQLGFIGKLKKLRVLSLSESDIVQLPDDLKQLIKLQIFDISNCSKLTKIQSGVISSLTNLEELYMRNTPIKWKVDGQANLSENASLSELRHLNKLTTLDIQILDVSHLPDNLFFDKLYSYKIVIGVLDAYLETDFKIPEKYEASRFLGLHLKDGCDIHSQKGIKMLFDRVENLLLEELSGVHDIFYELNLKGFPFLKHLSIISNSYIQSLIKPKDSDKHNLETAFPKLESLYLYNLQKMTEICSCDLSEPSFHNLKVIKIKLCNELKNVFLFSVVKRLSHLETIEVSECNSLLNIVSVEEPSNANESEVVFSRLRVLTLQSLSKFTGFYPTSSGELFHKKVLVSELERLELSSIQINNIWSNQPSKSPNFQHLIHLDVNDCCNLKYLMSFSMAKCLVRLQSLIISECHSMVHVFLKGQDGESTEQKKDGIFFQNLKNIKLSNMKSLIKIWDSEVLCDSFDKLDTMIIEKCDKLVNVFPCMGRFQSLCNMKVTNCISMKAIFDIEDKKGDVGDVSNLQDIHLESLPQLEHVWKWDKDRQDVVNLRILQKVWVQDCKRLEYIFPDFVAMCLENLEYLVVYGCRELRKIVSVGEDTNTNTSISILFGFPKLTTIKFYELPKLESFYRGAYELSCPALNDLSVEFCDKLQSGPLFPKMVFNNLKSMQIELRHAESSRSYMGNYRWGGNLQEFQLSSLLNTDVLYSFLHSNPNLKSLSLKDCFFEELVPFRRPPEIEKLGVVPKLKSLKLMDLPRIKMIGFERDAVLQRIEIFILKNCPCLITIGPSSVSFSYLTNLEVVKCDGLTHLISLRTAKSLGQLTTIKVIKCKSLVEIISEEGSEEEKARKIVFRQLETIELVSLKNLTSFCSSERFKFECPLLKKLVMSACPKLENFSAGVLDAPILKKISVMHAKEQKSGHWEGDINATIQKLFRDKNYLDGMDELSVRDYDDLLQKWQFKGPLQTNWFYSLETLKLEGCKIQPYAIPSNVLPSLKSVKELKVAYCEAVKGIFEKHEEMTLQLKRLTLDSLLNLEHVWEKNNGQGIQNAVSCNHSQKLFHSFRHLQEVNVCNCFSLKMLFPATTAKNVKKLEVLIIERCYSLQEIVGKEEEEVAAESTEMFEFPRLTTLNLINLPNLTCFYPERFTLKCPELKTFLVLLCHKLEVFQTQEAARQDSTLKPLFMDLKETISKLETLALDWKEMSVLNLGDLQDLNSLTLLYPREEDEQSILPEQILEKTPNLELLFLMHPCELEEFTTQNERMLRTLKRLWLIASCETKEIGSDNPSSWLNAICDQLHTLSVSEYNHMTKLANSKVSFSKLKKLEIVKCKRMKNLFTSSTAKNFTQLEELIVQNCGSMTEIVADDEESTSGDVKFERLEKIDLYLRNLTCFHSGKAALKLPSLIRVDLQKCFKMKIFSRAVIHAESFRGIYSYQNSNNELFFYKDLNATVKWLFLLQQKCLALGRHRELVEEIWHVKPAPDRSFSMLESLEVVGCEFSEKPILPSHLLPLLSKLKELKVQKCESVEVIFDVKGTPTHLGLKKLVLEELPNLKQVWNEDPEGRISFPFLEEVLVERCKSITSLFPASIAKGTLKLLSVKNCEGLLEIFAKDKEATTGKTQELMLESLTLRSLPNLKYFDHGTHIREWPKLTIMDVYDCQNLKLFEKDSQNCPDSHREGQDCLPTEQKSVLSADKEIAA
ncbi:hypothetical protein RIF29_15694 [Crotalaria pallida]|uniref:AAA+ ATPase domain-containing protein n=1 Tax=Crotalaria pallida TaxID=3830 RepID=A0AAN9IBE0_CROPI